MKTRTLPKYDPKNYLSAFILVLAVVSLGSTRTTAFLTTPGRHCPAMVQCTSRSRLLSTPEDEDSAGDSEGADLAAEFFQMAQLKGISIDESDLLDDDDEEEEEDPEEDDEDDDEEPNIPQGAIDAFVGYDPNANEQMYSEVKDRVLDTAGGFVDMISGPDEDDEEDDEASPKAVEPSVYTPPTTVPDPELTAGEVVLLVLSALKNNDTPTTNRGVEILFGYSSPGSQIMQEEGLTAAEYGEFLKETEYKALFEHLDATIEKGTYSFEGKKGFFTARLQTGQDAGDSISVNFILSGSGPDDDAAWLIDSILIRPQSIRRRRRK